MTDLKGIDASNRFAIANATINYSETLCELYRNYFAIANETYEKSN